MLLLGCTSLVARPLLSVFLLVSCGRTICGAVYSLSVPTGADPGSKLHAIEDESGVRRAL